MEPGSMEAFSKLVGLIYDTVVDPEAWTSVLVAIAAYAEATRSLLILEDALDPGRSQSYLSFDDPDWTRSYLEAYLLINPMRLATVAQVTAGDVVLTRDFMTEREYGRTRFSREFLAQRDLVDVAVVVLEKTATSITVLSLLRHQRQGFADDAVRAKLRLLGPHVRRAAAIGGVLDRQKLEAGTLADTLDRLEGAVFLLDGGGAVLHANDSARKLLADGRVVRSTASGLLVPHDAGARTALADALAGARGGDDGLGRKGESIAFGSDGRETILGHVIALTSGARRDTSARYHAVAALFMRAMRFEVPPAAQALGPIFKLTRRELAVLMSIVEVGGVPETAAVLGLAEDTVRSYVKSIFRKTGVSRQADLVKLVASTASPFTPNR